MSNRAAIYVRLSKRKAGERQVPMETQEADARALADRLGLVVAKVYPDEGRSAWAEDRKRPKWNDLNRDLPRYDAVIGWASDRFTRDEEEWHRFVRMADRAGVRVITVTDGVDTATEDRLTPSVRASVAAEESRKTSKRTRRGLAVRREEGAAHGGVRRYGYTRGDVHGELVVVPDEAAIVREAAQRVIEGESVSAIANDLNRRGVPSASGGPWGRQSLRTVLTGPTIVGRRSFDQTVEPRWPAIIDRETSEAVRARLAASPRSTLTPPGRRVLRGFVMCGRCGARLTGSTRNSSGVPDYVCKRPADGGCGGIRIAAEGLEEFVRDVVISQAATPAVRAALEGADDRAEVERLTRRLTRLEAIGDELAADYGTGRIGRRAHQRASEANDHERATIERKIGDLLAAASPILADAPRTDVALRRWWDAADDTRRRALIGALLSAITIAPGRRGPTGFQIDRVSVTWRGTD